MFFKSSSSIISLTTRGVKKQVKHVKTFYTEYNVLKKLQDVPGIIKLLDTDEDLGVLYLEYHQLDLHEYILSNNKIIGTVKRRSEYIDETITIFKKLLPVIDTCHQRGFIHGDLKPENILLDKKNNPILIDFGHSLQLNEIYLHNQPIGTEGFIPPELNKGIKGYFTDVYSLGITLYKLLTCKKPFILDDGSIDYNFIDDEELIPYEIINIIYEMTDPCYENRPSIETLINEL